MNLRDTELIARAKATLKQNTYSAEGYLWSPYKCITPGVNYFFGIWNWDSAFHAVGVSRWDVDLAEQSILGFLQFQQENGFLPDVIHEDNSIEDVSSKPPMFAWATEKVYKRGKNLDFVKKAYPKLVLNENFWVNERSSDGLFYYGGYKEKCKDEEDYIKYVKWESGWDNSPRWDKGITNLWAIDLNCFMVMFYRSLSYLAGQLGLDSESSLWAQKGEQLSQLIITKMWDDKAKCFADTDRFTGENSEVITPASFMPLYIKIATKEQAEEMNKVANNRFKGKMPTVAFDDPSYSARYWRGPTWLNVAYFAAKGLKNYSFSIADQIKENILDMCFTEKRGIYENYNSTTGEGQYCDHFSWSSVFVLEFIYNFEEGEELQ